MSSLTIDSTSRHLVSLGVYLAHGDDCVTAVKEALKVGYRRVDSAQLYKNEDDVGKAVAASKKVHAPGEWRRVHLDGLRQHPDLPLEDRPGLTGGAGVHRSLPVVHAPRSGQQARVNNWEALVRAQKEGWVKDIGVSNFGVKHLKDLSGPTPTVNPDRAPPVVSTAGDRRYCNEHSIVVQAYCPLVKADPKKLNDPVISQIAKKYNKEGAQILVRWSLQKGFSPLPKSVSPARIGSNADLHDFELTMDDTAAIDGLDQGADGAIDWNAVDTP